MEDLNLIVKMKFGSHLYGTSTEDSDVDLKGVFLPTERQVLLNEVPKNYIYTTGDSSGKNTSTDVDVELFSIHYFIQLASEGQTIALDMLHAPDEFIIEKTPIWDAIQKNKDKFYTKNLQAFIGYARSQASKYGIRAGRLGNIRQVINFLENFIEK